LKIQFHGAARTVTGSMHLLSIDGQKILLDCGLFQGRRKESRRRNRKLPFAAGEIHSCVLSHSHIDHSGNLPSLVKHGFKGHVYATRAAADLCGHLLRDSAYIQQKDAEYLNRKKSRKGFKPVEPLYTMADAKEALHRFMDFPYGHKFNVGDNVKCTFLEAGHILGSAQVLLEIKRNGSKKRILFTGDLGRKEMPILRDPAPVGPVDALIIESTYGDRLHGPMASQLERLYEILHETYDRRGKIIIPAFSVGRTQRIVYFLHRLETEGRLPAVPIYVDSPLSVNVTEVFRAHPECYDKGAAEFLSEEKDPFGFHRLHYIKDVEDSKRLNRTPGPYVVISASGMCEAGRILHHLKHAVADEKNTILIIGYQAEHTLGHRLVHKAGTVKIYGETYPVRARVEVMNAFSAHADRDGLLRHVNERIEGKPRQTFVVHGDEDQALAFAGHLRAAGLKSVAVPERGETFEIE